MSLDTRGIDPQRLLPQSLEDRLLGWLGRCGGLVLLGAVLILWMGLLSWSVADPSLTHATGVGPRNWLGPLGAIASDLLLQMLGLGAIAALLAPMFWAVELTRRERLASPRAMVGYYPLSILALAGGLSALPTIADWPLHHGLGGVVGDGLFKLATKAFSVVNEDRARLAAGIGLNAGGLAMMGKSIALDLEGLRAAIFPIRAGDDAPGETLASWMSRWAARWRQWRASREHRKQRPAFAPAARPAASADYAPGQRDFGSHTLFVPERVVPERAAPVPRQSYVLAAGFEGYGSPQAGGDTHSSADETGSSFAAYEAEHRPPQSDLLESDLVRDDDFDQSTEAASRAIAARFAPPGANVASQPSQAATGKSPVSAAKISGLLGGVPFRRAQPDWKRPSLNLLKRPAVSRPGPEFTQTVMRGNARLLEDVLKDFGVKGEVKDIRPGPVVTLYELEPARGTKSSRVIGLADDIARSMSVASVRASVISGRNAIGLELPNVRREPVLLREMLDSDAYKASEAALPLALGKSIGGDPVVVDLARMPHLLVAGTTGSGKSVGINAMVLSLLYRHSPRECRMLMIDPKMLELSVYNGIPHLLTPVITDPHKAVAALNWAVSEMEERYKRMATLSVRNIDVFNNRVRNARKRGELLSRTVQTGFDKSGQAIFENQKMNLEPMPHIVVVVDEFADLMIVAGKDVETAVQRLAQMARAAGIHLIMATQRPSVDIITGTIKANFPTRISFKVTSKIDSRTILNEQGAEQLLGQGDMLYSMGAGQVVRVHGAFVTDEEVEAVADALRQQGPPHYVEGILDAPSAAQSAGGDRMASDDDLYDRAVAIVLRDRKASTSYIQRRLSIGYNRAADLIERMEREGLITPANSVGKREILGSGNVDAA